MQDSERNTLQPPRGGSRHHPLSPHLNSLMKADSVMPSGWELASSITPSRRMEAGTVASIRASRESKPSRPTISFTSFGVMLLCRGSNLGRSQRGKEGMRICESMVPDMSDHRWDQEKVPRQGP